MSNITKEPLVYVLYRVDTANGSKRLSKLETFATNELALSAKIFKYQKQYPHAKFEIYPEWR